MSQPKKRGASAPRPRSGYVRPDQRKTIKVTLELRPEVHTLLLSLATEIGEGDPKRQLSRTIEEALHALNREMDRELEEDDSWEGIGTGMAAKAHAAAYARCGPPWSCACGPCQAAREAGWSPAPLPSSTETETKR
jgi:hypothetical protein